MLQYHVHMIIFRAEENCKKRWPVFCKTNNASISFPICHLPLRPIELWAILLRYLKKSSIVNVNVLYYFSAFSCCVRKNLTKLKQFLAISACTSKVRAPFNTPLKLYEVFIVITHNLYPPSLDNAHWCSRPCKRLYPMVCIFTRNFSSAPLGLYTSGSDANQLPMIKYSRFSLNSF